METSDLAVLIKVVQMLDRIGIYRHLYSHEKELVADAREVIKKYCKPSAS